MKKFRFYVNGIESEEFIYYIDQYEDEAMLMYAMMDDQMRWVFTQIETYYQEIL